MNKILTIPQAVDALVARHGSLRKAARIVQINYAYLSRLRSEEKTEPTDAVLRRLGLRRIVTYETIKPVRTVLEIGGNRLEMKHV